MANLPIQTRSQTISVLVGTISGLLAIGLAIPFLLADDPPEVAERERLVIGDGSIGGDLGDGAGSPLGSSPLTTAPAGATGGAAEPGAAGATTPAAGAPGATAPAAGTPGGGATAGGQPAAGDPAPGSGTSTPPTTAGAAPGPDAGANQASDVGVSPDGIDVTVMVADLGGLAEAGFAVDLGDEQGLFDAMFAEMNAAGGLNGRQVRATYERFDPLSQDDMRRACIAATEDRQSFTVFNSVGYYGAAVLCVTEEHGVPYLSYSPEPDSWYDRSGGLMFSFGMSKDRIMRNLAFEMDQLGLFSADKVFGTLESDFPGDKPAADSFAAIMGELGYDIAVRASLSSDFAEAQAQVPIAVQEMQAAGVTDVILIQNFIASAVFVQQAEKRLFFPQYYHSDFATGSQDGATDQMPDSYDGAVALTTTRSGEPTVGLPQPAVEADCEARVEANGGPPMDRDSGENYLGVAICTMIDQWAGAVRSQGADLTRTGMAAALANAPAFEASGLLGSNQFTPSQYTSGVEVRTLQWNLERDGQSCRCWIPVDSPRPGRF